MQIVKRMVSLVLTAAVSMSMLTEFYGAGVLAADGSGEQISLDTTLSIMNHDVLGLDVYAGLEQSSKQPELRYTNEENETDTAAFVWDDGLKAYKATIAIPASEMNDIYSCQVYVDNNKTGAEFSCSAAENAYRLLNSSDISDEARSLICSMLNYGAMSQIYFSHDTEHLVNADLSENEKKMTDLNDAGIVGKRYLDEKALAEKGLQYEASTLIADSGLSMRVYFSLKKGFSEPPQNVTINGIPETFGTKNYEKKKYYYLDISDVSMLDFDQAYEMNVDDAAAASFTVNSYLLSASDKQEVPELGDLASSLYAFHEALCAYRDAQQIITNDYEVQFAVADGINAENVILPQTELYPEGTLIDSLPVPYRRSSTFLGWYYDAEMQYPAEPDDAVDCNMVLYACMTDNDVNRLEQDAASSLTVNPAQADIIPVSGGSTPPSEQDKIRILTGGVQYSFEVFADSEEMIRAALTYQDASDQNADVEYQIRESVAEGSYLILSLKPLDYNHVYIVELLPNSGVFFCVEGEKQPEEMRTLNIVPNRNEAENLELNHDMIGIHISEVSDLTGDAFSSMYDLDIDGTSETAESSYQNGTFCYSGSMTLEVSDIAAIYDGVKPLERDVDCDDPIAYIKITSVDGDRIGYTAAEFEEIIEIPDVIPLDPAYDLIPDDGDRLTLDLSDPVFGQPIYADCGLDRAYGFEQGDYLVLGDIEAYMDQVQNDEENTSLIKHFRYVRVSDVNAEENTGYVTLDYVDSSIDEYKYALEMAYSRVVDVEASDDEIAEMESEIVTQAEESGFVDEAVDYIANVAQQTNGFEELSKEFEVAVLEGDPKQLAELNAQMLTADSSSSWKCDIKKKDVNATVKFGDKLSHYKDKKGVYAVLNIAFEAEYYRSDDKENKVVVSVNAAFYQEVMLNYDFDFSFKLKYALGFIPTGIKKAVASLKFEVGTYTNIGVAATAKTLHGGKQDDKEKNDPKFTLPDGNAVNESQASSKIIDLGKQVMKLINDYDKEQKFMGNDAGDPEHINTLTKRYEEMMKNAEANWITLYEKQLTDVSIGSFYKIINVHAPVIFSVEATAYITMGLTFQYGYARGYVFSVDLKNKEVTSRDYLIEESNMSIDAYVMGTIGIKAGVAFCPRINIISDKLFYVGFNVYAGLKYQLYGYFFYHLDYSESQGKDTYYSGAIYMDLSLCLSITFSTQAFSSDKLKAKEAVWDTEIPLWGYGSKNPVVQFNPISDADTNFTLVKDKVLKLPASIYNVKQMDLTDGKSKDCNIYQTGLEYMASFRSQYNKMMMGLLSWLYGEEKANILAEQLFDETFEEYLKQEFDPYYVITFTNPHFSYNSRKNEVTIDTDRAAENGYMIISYRNDLFTSNLQRKIKISWSDPDQAYILHFVSDIAEDELNDISNSVQNVIGQPGMEIADTDWPADPVREGCTFLGWYDADGNKISKMTVFPQTNGEREVTYTSRWERAKTAIGTVNLYIRKPTAETLQLPQQPLTDSAANYLLVGSSAFESAKKAGAFNGMDIDFTSLLPKKNITEYSDGSPVYANDVISSADNPFGIAIPDGLEINSQLSGAYTIKSDGSTVIDMYLSRKQYSVVMRSEEDGLSHTVKYEYGGKIDRTKLKLTRQGYTLAGWAENVPEYMPARDIELTAKWTPSTNTRYYVEYYQEGQLLFGIECTGTTDAEVSMDDLILGVGTNKAIFDYAMVNYTVLDENSAVPRIQADGEMKIRLFFHPKQETSPITTTETAIPIPVNTTTTTKAA